MIRNQFVAGHQQQQHQPTFQASHNQTAPVGNAPGGVGTPAVDLSHLTAEERAMIQSVMAKAEMVDGNPTSNSLAPNTGDPNARIGASQAINFHQQQLAALQSQQLQQIHQPNLNCQPVMQQQQQQQQQQPYQMMTGAGQQNRFNLTPGNLAGGSNQRLPNGPSLQNSQQLQQSIAFQQQPSLMNQMNTPRGQLPSLEQRTQELVSQINSQFNLGGAYSSSSSNWQNNPNNQTQQRTLAPNTQTIGINPQPTTNINHAMNQQQFNSVPSQMQRQQQQGLQTAMGMQQHQITVQNLDQMNQPQNLFQSNVVAFGQQQTFANQQMAPNSQIVFDPQGQQTLMNQQNRALNQTLQRANSIQTDQATVVPNQSSFDGRFITTLDMQNQMLLRQQQLSYGSQSCGPGNFESNFLMGPQIQSNVDERQNIKFGHKFERGYTRSDQEEREDLDRHSRASRRSRAAQWMRIKSTDTMPNELERERTARWRHEPTNSTTCRRLPKPGQVGANQAQGLRSNEQQRSCSSQLAVTDRFGRDKSHSNRSNRSNRQASGHDLYSSYSSLSDEELSSASSSANNCKNDRIRNKPAGRVSKSSKSTKSNNDNERQTRVEETNVDADKKADNKTSQLMSELKLNEQASQVMEQQQLLIKQSQELIKLQQAQLEQQAKMTRDETCNTAPTSTAATNNFTATAGARLDEKLSASESVKRVQVKRDEIGVASKLEDDQITDSSNDLEQLVHGKRSRASAKNLKSNSSSQHGECLLDSPTNSTDSDSELLSCSLQPHRSQRRHRSTPTSRGKASKSLSKRLLITTGLTPSPLPVEAAIQLHQLQTLCTSSNEPLRGRDKTLRSQRQARSRVELLRSRSVCNSPPVLMLGRTRQSSPDAMSEFSQRMAQRKLLPDPPTNAVPLTPSMVRKMVETQRVAATSSSKLPTSVNAQSTLLTNTLSLRQPCLDESPSMVHSSNQSIANVGYQSDQRSCKPAPRPLGSYTARISGAQVSFAPSERSLTSAAAARHQKLSALSRADLSKFLDFTYGTSILKSSNQQQQAPLRQYASNDWSRRHDERYRYSSGRTHVASSTLSQSMAGERLSFESHSDRLNNDEFSSRFALASRRRRSSEGDNSAGYLTYRPRFPNSKHVNFEQNHNQPTSSLLIERGLKTGSFLAATPRYSRQSHLSDYRPRQLHSSDSQRYEWPCQQDRESRPARYRTQTCSIDGAYPGFRSEWSPRSSWATNLGNNQSGGLCNRYVQTRSTSSDYESRLTSRLDDRNLSGLTRNYMRYPYKQRSFDTS